MAGRKAPGFFCRVALGTGAVASSNCPGFKSGASADAETAGAGQQLGSAPGAGMGCWREPLAGGAAGLWHVLWPRGKRGGGGGADPDRLTEGRLEPFYASDRGLAELRWRRSAVS